MKNHKSLGCCHIKSATFGLLAKCITYYMWGKIQNQGLHLV